MEIGGLKDKCREKNSSGTVAILKKKKTPRAAPENKFAKECR